MKTTSKKTKIRRHQKNKNQKRPKKNEDNLIKKMGKNEYDLKINQP